MPWSFLMGLVNRRSKGFDSSEKKDVRTWMACSPFRAILASGEAVYSLGRRSPSLLWFKAF